MIKIFIVVRCTQFVSYSCVADADQQAPHKDVSNPEPDVHGTVVLQSKRRVSAWSCGEWSRAALALFSAECVACARTAASCYQGCWLPKYKRDPEIMLDDENLGQHPSVHNE